MKNATTYQKKLKKLLSGMGKASAGPIGDPIRALVEAVLLEDANRRQVQTAVEALDAEFVDYNELRVSPVKEIVERTGKDYPFARQKAQTLVKALNAVFDKTGTMTMDYMHKMPKRDLRRHLLEVGLSPFAAAYLTLTVFGGHAVPVDRSLVVCLEAEGCIHPGSGLADVQGFLERVIAQKDSLAANEFFRRMVEKSSKLVARKLSEQLAAAVAGAEADEPQAPKPAVQEAPQAPPPPAPAAKAAPKPAGRGPRRGAAKAKASSAQTQRKK